MKILGLSFDYHDSAAALLVDGVVAAAGQEERFSRTKHDAKLPAASIAYCLAQAGLTASDLDAVVFFEHPMLKFDRILYSGLRSWSNGGAKFVAETLRSWMKKGKFEARARIAEHLGIPQSKIHYVTHHQSHAGSAFLCSPFDRATIITMDGVGEYETASVSVGEGTSIRHVSSVSFPHSVGLLYSAFTAFLGFEVNEGEYKVMGMAGFGKPRHREKVASLVNQKGTQFKIDQSYFNFLSAADLPFNDKFVDLFGKARKPDCAFQIGDLNQEAAPGSVEAESRHYADIAASLQVVTEDIIIEYVRAAVAETGISSVVMAGGVALNSLANGRVQRELGYDLYVQPAAGDSGGALGAALYHHCTNLGTARPAPLTNMFLGSEHTQEEALQALSEQGIESYVIASCDEELVDIISDHLKSGAVVGWHQGRFEWGPRALGCRSILGNPSNPDMQRIINEKIKFREPFRPFAPAVLAERATEYFEVDAPRTLSQPENFMLSVARVRPEMRRQIPSVTHVDGTARVQYVWKQHDTMFRKLIEAFAGKTGVPILLNTSFNRRGEPMVATPADALRTFSWSGLDYLAIGRVVVSKELRI